MRSAISKLLLTDLGKKYEALGRTIIFDFVVDTSLTLFRNLQNGSLTCVKRCTPQNTPTTVGCVLYYRKSE